MKKISSVNLDKLINDFSQIEKVCKDIQQLWNIRESVTDFVNGGSQEKIYIKKKKQDKNNGNVFF